MQNRALIAEYENRLAEADALLKEKLKRVDELDPVLKEKDEALKVIEDKIAEKSTELEKEKLFSVLFADGSAGVFPESELQTAETIPKGEFEMLSSLLSGDVEDTDPYLTYPDESKKWKGICHAHIRGKSIHLDFRVGFSEELKLGIFLKDHMLGWTLYIPKGLSKAPNSFREAQSLYKNEIESIVKDTLSNPMKKFNCGTKEPEPVEWATYSGRVEPLSVDPEAVGSTEYEWGDFIIIDKFDVQFGAQKSYFHEYFCDGKIFNGRLVFRLLENKEEWKKTDEGLMTWFMFNALKSPTPYAISTRAVKKQWVPPYEVSALPRDVRSKIPEKFRYWTIKDATQRRKVRDELVNEIKKKLLKLDSISQGEFKFLKQTWKGQEVIRKGPSRTQFYFVLKHAKNYFSLALNTSLLDSKTAAGLPFRHPAALWGAEGELPPGSKLNPTKATPSKIELLDKGKATLLSEGSFKKFILKGKKMKGTFVAFPQEDGKSNMWTMQKSEVPEFEEK